jgi:DNA-binding CsgD family transcriptional regulator/5-methylcytosine-specific restriction endonuclease McrA
MFVPTLREDISELLELGLSQAEIARLTGVAGPTVNYHVAQLWLELRAAPPPARNDDVDPGSAVRTVATRGRVAELLADGVPRAEVARRLGISKATVSYHARRLGETIDERAARRYDWSAVQRYYDAGHSVTECIERFGFSRYSWHAAVKRGVIAARPQRMSVEQLCKAGTARNRFHLKRRLLELGLKEERCERCGIAEWHGARLVMALHHVNGDRHDNRLDNLQLLCPNCHSQTENFSGRNRREVVRAREAA